MPPTGESKDERAWLRRARERLADRMKPPRAWWWPEPAVLALEVDEKDWRRQHDVVSDTLRRTMLALIAFCFFSLFTLSSDPDLKLLASDADVPVPLADVTIHFVAFLYVGPLVLVGLTLYLHIFLGHWLRLARAHKIDRLPYLFNLDSLTASVSAALIFYWLPPAVLLYFAYRALPTREAHPLVLVALVMTATLAFVQLRRAVPGWRRLWLWVPFAGAVLLAGHTVFAWVSGERLLYERGLDLEGARLAHQDLERAELRKAKLNDAILRNANLRRANLVDAKLRGAELEHADLENAQLRLAKLGDADLECASLRHAELPSAEVENATLTKADLRGAKMAGVRLEGAILVGADLRGADLRGAKGLTQAQIDVACVDEKTRLSPPLEHRDPAATCARSQCGEVGPNPSRRGR